MDRLPPKATGQGTTFDRDRGRGERARDPWRMMSELLDRDRKLVATKSIERPPVRVASFEC